MRKASESDKEFYNSNNGGKKAFPNCILDKSKYITNTFQAGKLFLTILELLNKEAKRAFRHLLSSLRQRFVFPNSALKLLLRKKS